MKQLLKIVLVLVTLSSCNKDKSTETNFLNQMSVKSASTYTVIVEKNIIYSQGLSHQTLNSASYSIVDLKLDVYKPADNSKKRPGCSCKWKKTGRTFIRFYSGATETYCRIIRLTYSLNIF